VKRQRREILGNVALRKALDEAIELDATYVPNSGNLGDGVIALGNSHLFDEWGLNFRSARFSRESIADAGNHLVLGGGGGMVRGLYYELGSYLLQLLKSGGTACILPSTIKDFGSEFVRYADQLTIFARERTTYDELLASGMPPSRVHLCHDLAFALNPIWIEAQKGTPPYGTLMAFREDDEQTFAPDRDENIDLSLFLNGSLWHDREFTEASVSRLAQFLASYASVKTNRLHIGILSFLLGVDLSMFDNSYGKNKSIFEYSLYQEVGVKFIGDEGKAEVDSETSISSPSWEGFRKKLAWYEKTRREWWEPQIEKLTNDLQSQAELRQDWFEPELNRLEAAAKVLEAEKNELSRSNDLLKEEVSQLEAGLAEAQTEIETLKRRVEDVGIRKDLELRDLQFKLSKVRGDYLHERSRVAAAGSQIKQLRQKIDDAKEETAKARKVSDDLWDTKVDWWEPELERRALQIERLEDENSRLRKALGEP